MIPVGPDLSTPAAMSPVHPWTTNTPSSVMMPKDRVGVAEREELTETGLGSTARCCGRRRHRQANSVRVCSPTSRRVASLRPRSAGLTALTPAPRTLVQIGSCRRCSLIHPLHVVVDVPSRMTLFRATADSRPPHRRASRRARSGTSPRRGTRAARRPSRDEGRSANRPQSAQIVLQSVIESRSKLGTEWAMKILPCL